VFRQPGGALQALPKDPHVAVAALLRHLHREVSALLKTHFPKPLCLPLYVAVFTQIKRQFAEGAEAAEVVEAAERHLFGLRLEVIEVPLMKIEAAVDREGKIAAVRCRAALDLGVETVFESTAPGYKLENVHVDKSAGTAAGAVRRGEEEGWVERLLEEGVLRPADVRRR
jgi:hypothetical protein